MFIANEFIVNDRVVFVEVPHELAPKIWRVTKVRYSNWNHPRASVSLEGYSVSVFVNDLELVSRKARKP